MLGYHCHLKDPRSLSWTPVRVLEIPSSLAVEIKNLVALNKHKGKVYPLSHPDYGMDVKLKRDFTETGFVNYSARRARDCRLTQEELEYLIYPLNVLLPETSERPKVEWENIKPRLAKNNEHEKNDLANKATRNRDDHSLIDKRRNCLESDNGNRKINERRPDSSYSFGEVITEDLVQRRSGNRNKPHRKQRAASKIINTPERRGIVCGMTPLFD
jgi:hypothetical protein